MISRVFGPIGLLRSDPSPHTEDIAIAQTRALAHHFGDLKILDQQYVIDVGGLASAISDGSINRFASAFFDADLLDQSAARINEGTPGAGDAFFFPALARPALAIAYPSGDIVVIDGHRRARGLFSRVETDMAPVVIVNFDDAREYMKHLGELSTEEQHLIAAMTEHPISFSGDPSELQSRHSVLVFVPPSTEGRPADDDEIGVLVAAFYGVSREVTRRAEQRHRDDPRRRVRSKSFSKEAYLRGIVTRLGDVILAPAVAVATSTLSAEYSEAVADLTAFSRFHFGDDEIVLSRLVDCDSDELEQRLVILSRAVLAAKWSRSHSKAVGVLIDPRSHAKKRFTGDELSKKITGGAKQTDLRDLPLRAMCDIARLVGVNIAKYYPQVRNAHEIVEWHRILFFSERGRWRDIGDRRLAMNFSLWHRLWRMSSPTEDPITVPEIALLWRSLFNALAVVAIPPDAPTSTSSNLLDLYLEMSDALFHARRGAYRTVYR